MRLTIRYQVIKCQQDIWEIAKPLIRQLPLPPESRGVIYIRSYAHGESVANEIDYPFYKATATSKQKLLKQWANGNGKWIVATGALRTNINIPGVIFIIHLGRPYELTSFMQQAKRGRQASEISNSIVIFSSSSGNSQFLAPRQKLVNAYSIKAQNEAALTKYLESHSCRQAVLAQHLDKNLKRANYLMTNSILCDRCQKQKESSALEQTKGNSSGSPESSNAIYQAYQLNAQRTKQLERFH